MATTIKSYGFDGVWAYPLLPISGGTVNSEPFTIPQRARSIALHVPNLAGTDTIKLQALTPAQDIESTTEAWVDIFVFDLTDGTTEALDGIPESQVTVIPTSALGSTVIRLVSSGDESGAPVRVPVFMNFGGG